MDEAGRCYREAIAADPSDPLARLNLGFTQLEQGDWANALTLLQQALALRRPADDFVHEAHFLAGRAHEAAGRHDQALASLEAAVRAKADFVEPIDRALRICQASGRHADAVVWAERLLAVQPSALARFVLGSALAGCGRHAESAPLLAQACAEEPQQLESALLYFHVLFRLRRFGEALVQAEHVLALTGPDAGALVNVAATLEELDRLDEALVRVEQALALDPSRRDALVNRVAILIGQHRVREAADAARRALQAYPDDVALHMNLGFALLLLGDFEAGWAEHEWRIRSPAFDAYRVPAQYPPWRGESLAGKAILVYSEQGFGDGIQFVRYVGELARTAREVILQLPEGLAPLAEGLAPNCRQLPQGAAMPAVDFHCALMSLPYVLGTRADSIPAAVPYLRAQAQRVAAWRERLGEGLQIGIAWSGKPTHVNDRNRSLRLDTFRQVDVAGCHFVSLQPQVREYDRQALASWPQLRDCGPELGDFSDTAALIEALDLVITVDTSVAHLAGALGRPVWILLPHVPDWRWMLEGERTPWYPTARLYRQPAAGDWNSVLARVRADLAALASEPAGAADAAQWLARGNAALGQSDLAGAADCYRRAAAADPRHAPARLNLGYAELEQNRPVQALAALDEAAALDPTLADVPFLQGRSLIALGRTADAIVALRKAVALQPDFTHAWDELGGLLSSLGHLDEALAAARRLVELRPQDAQAWTKLGLVLYRLQQFDEALSACERAVALPGATARDFYDLGCCRLAFNDVEGVLRAAAAGLALSPADADLQWLQAVAWLLRGDMRRGWPAYESRWHRQAAEVPKPPASTRPDWDGRQDLAGQRLLVYAEQAFGDTIQFLRFLRPLQQRGARLLLLVQPALAGLAAGLDLPGVRIVTGHDALPDHDFHCSLMGLPWRLGVTLETLDGAPYLRPDPALRARWEARLGAKTQPRLGVTWSGKPLPDPNRSVPLAQLLPHLPSGFQLVSLQKEVKPEDRAALAACPDLLHFGDALETFADTAALADCMDVVVSIDTSVAHLVGALGKPMLVLLPFVPDWRWMLDRSDTPWYRHAQLLRQDARRAWPPVLEGLGRELDGLARRGPPA